MNFRKVALILTILLIFTAEAYSRCLEYDESVKKHVLKARELVKEGKVKSAIKAYKEHLSCWKDETVYNELGFLYEFQNKYYLAGIAYKKAKAKEKLIQVIEKQAMTIKANENSNFEIISWQTSDKLLKKYKAQKFLKNTFFIIGALSTATGLGLFIHDKAGGINSLTAQYTLGLGGMSLISGGILLNALEKDTLKNSEAYGKLSESFKGDGGTTPDEFFIYSGIYAKNKKALAVVYRNNGVGLMIMSIPMFAMSIYGFFDSFNHYRSENEESSGGLFSGIEMLGHIFQIASLAPAILSVTGGIILLAKASKWEKLNTEPDILTLTSITPVINPVSKTYGLSLGFSF